MSIWQKIFDSKFSVGETVYVVPTGSYEYRYSNIEKVTITDADKGWWYVGKRKFSKETWRELNPEFHEFKRAHLPTFLTREITKEHPSVVKWYNKQQKFKKDKADTEAEIKRLKKRLKTLEVREW